MEFNESQQIGMHASFISSIFMKDGNRFYTFRDIADQAKEAEWSKFDHIMPALEQLIRRGEIEHDQTYGYCRKGSSGRLRQEMSIPKMSRADFDKLTPQAQAEYCRDGGKLQ